jgi:hypothetical protein
VFNEALKTQGDVKKAHDELYGGANNGDLKNISKWDYRLDFWGT